MTDHKPTPQDPQFKADDVLMTTKQLQTALNTALELANRITSLVVMLLNSQRPGR